MTQSIKKYIENYIEISRKYNKLHTELWKVDLIDHKNIQSEIENNDLNEKLEDAFQFLKSKEEIIIKYRYGFINGKCYSRREIAEILNITEEQVRTIEKNALKKLRNPQINNSFINFAEKFDDFDSKSTNK